ncbi:hypothetical protein KO506_10405 [Polaribacter vadi]|uniref:hypothetical protein n=1 Tax=Polaribacter TaxID=52959 RepID=UPI001C082A85|nr:MULTISPECIES: hypothetical protein [Polaribacter]MBU3011816.1 hypothetical protein [Polaribacter vadi]MDO6741629.1 hypothetical protein [Polaribacter sp. 1_MG-2023]
MRKTIKYLSLINIVGITVVSATLILSILIKPFAWSELLIALNLLISIPFIISGIVTLKNIKNPNERKIQNTLIGVFLILGLPSIALPFAYEIGGLLISLIILGIGLWGILKIKNIMHKMIFINTVGVFFLVINSLATFVIINGEIY